MWFEPPDLYNRRKTIWDMEYMQSGQWGCNRYRSTTIKLPKCRPHSIISTKKVLLDARNCNIKLSRPNHTIKSISSGTHILHHTIIVEFPKTDIFTAKQNMLLLDPSALAACCACTIISFPAVSSSLQHLPFHKRDQSGSQI